MSRSMTAMTEKHSTAVQALELMKGEAVFSWQIQRFVALTCTACRREATDSNDIDRPAREMYSRRE